MLRGGLGLLLLLLAAGCAQPRHGLESCLPPDAAPPAGVDTVLSLRYRVRTDAGRPAAQEVDRFMERAAALWTPMFGVPDPAAMPLDIHLYRRAADLRRLLATRNLTSLATGLYLPAPNPAIHVACLGDETGHPYRTLLHEGTHQFMHLGAGFRVPGRPAAPRLALPLWLSEGLASYYEAAFVTPDLLQPGRPDAARLAELQQALRTGRAPPLATLFDKRYGDPFSSLDYAAAWGVIYVLMQESPPPWAAGGRGWVKERIDQGRSGGGAGAAPEDTGRWWESITTRTRTAFEEFIAARGLSITAWEELWHAWILAHP